MASRRTLAAGTLILLVTGLILYRAGMGLLTARVHAGVLNSLSQASGGTGRFRLHFARLSGGDVAAGRVRNLELRIEEAVFSGLRYRLIQVRSGSVRIDRASMRGGGPFTVREIGQTLVSAQLDQAALNEYRAGRWPELPVVITLKEGRVAARTHLELALGAVDVGFSGRLAPEKGAIRLKPEALEIRNLSLPREWVESALGSLDQVFSLAFPVRLPLPVEPERVTVHDGWVEVILTGGARVVP